MFVWVGNSQFQSIFYLIWSFENCLIGSVIDELVVFIEFNFMHFN
ncbi:hypothetical protein OIU84_025091, partial [Salix udensis]